jgi:acyl-CoA reductase-like NAD-dependent aldehyde dehydrogenase
MKVVQEETFAPVASMIGCRDLEEGLRRADGTEQGPRQPFSLRTSIESCGRKEP